MTTRPTWWPNPERNPPLSGHDLDDYSGERWIPTPQWASSAFEDNAEAIAAIRAAIPTLSAPLGRRMSKWLAHLEEMYRWLCTERVRGIAQAERVIARGQLPPRRPKRLRLAREAERNAWSTLRAKAEQYLGDIEPFSLG